jgi:hypothetical protein
MSEISWPEMFDDEVMVKLQQHLQLSDNVEDARSDFVATGKRIREIIEVTPSSFDYGPDDMSLSKRARWLRQNVLNPMETLRNAVSNSPMYSSYPEKSTSALSVDSRGQLAGELTDFYRHVDDLHDDLVIRAKPRNLSHNTEMRREFLYWIAEVVRRHAPHVDVKRSYTGVPEGGNKINTSPFFAAVKLAYVEITGEQKPQLEEHFRELTKMFW